MDSTDRPRRVALALGSGGARGYAHIGALQVLAERGYDVRSVAGSSMGALVGGVFAAGKLDAYTDWVTSFTQRDIFRLLDPTLKSPGAIRAEKITTHVRDLVADVAIEDLPMPYTAVATDLLEGTEVWFRDGPLDAAIRASIAMPTIITPRWRAGRLLADGGILNPLPVDAARQGPFDLTVAVTLGGERTGLLDEPEPKDRNARHWQDRLRQRSEQMARRERLRPLAERLAERLDRSEELREAREEARGEARDVASTPGDPTVAADPVPEWLKTSDVLTLSLDAMQARLTHLSLAGNPPDVLVSIPKDVCRSLDFHRAAPVIEFGRVATAMALDDYEEHHPRSDAPGPA